MCISSRRPCLGQMPYGSYQFSHCALNATSEPLPNQLEDSQITPCLRHSALSPARPSATSNRSVLSLAAYCRGKTHINISCRFRQICCVISPCLFVYISSAELSAGETYLTQQMEGLNDRFAGNGLLTDPVHCNPVAPMLLFRATSSSFACFRVEKRSTATSTSRNVARSIPYSFKRRSLLLTRLARETFELVPAIDHRRARSRISKQSTASKIDRDER